MKEVVLICDSFSSANFFVMTTVIRSLGESIHIHAIADTNEDGSTWIRAKDITYYPVHSWRVDVIRKIQAIKPKVLSRILESSFFRITNHFNNFFKTSYEKEIYSKSKQIIQNNNIKSVFSVCFRFYHHRVALNLSKTCDITWFQFWLDPYSNRYDMKSKLWRLEAEALERKFFQAVKCIYSLPEVFRGNRPIIDYEHKLIRFQIPYLINREVGTKNRNIVFAGSFVKIIREPEPVLSLLLSILDKVGDDLCFHFYVPDRTQFQKYQEESNGRLCFHNYVNHDELYKILAECYMLLNVGNYGTKQMPSKTIEYVSFRKPLLFFHKGEDDSSLEYLKDYPEVCYVDIENDDNANQNKLINFIMGEHQDIKYEDLIRSTSFYESTPEYLRSIIKLA